MAGFDFKSEIKRSVKRKRGLLKEVAMKLDPEDPSNKVLVGDEQRGFAYDERSGIIDRGQADRSEIIQKEIGQRQGKLRAFTQTAGGRNKKSKTINRITRYLSRLDTYVDDFKEEYFQENYEKQKELLAFFKEDLRSPRRYKLKTTDFENAAAINQIELDNFLEDVRKVWLRARDETFAGGLLNIRSQRLKWKDAFKLTPEIQKQADAAAAKRAARGKEEQELMKCPPDDGSKRYKFTGLTKAQYEGFKIAPDCAGLLTLFAERCPNAREKLWDGRGVAAARILHTRIAALKCEPKPFEKALEHGLIHPDVRAAAAKKVAAGKAGEAGKGGTAGKAVVDAETKGKLVSAEFDKDNQRFTVEITPVEESPLWASKGVPKLSPNGRKQLKASAKQENSHLNIFIKMLVSTFGGDGAEAVGLGPGGGQMAVWSLKGKEATGPRRVAVMKKYGDRKYVSAFRKAFQAAVPIEGGEEEGGLGGFMKGLSGLTGADTGGAFSRRRIPVEESKILKFEKTLQGSRQEKIHNKLISENKKLNEQDVDWGKAAAWMTGGAAKGGKRSFTFDTTALDGAGGAGAGAIPPAQQKAMQAAYQAELTKRGASAGSFTFADYLKYKYGAKAGTGILRKLGSRAASIGRGALSATKYVFSPAAKAAFSAWGGQSLGAAGASGVAGAFAAGAAIGAGIGLIFNWAISGTSLDSSKDRIKDAKGNPKYADWMLEMFSTGEGYLCSDSAPDGWQVKCAGAAGGFKQEEEVSVLKTYGITRGHENVQDYVDPTGFRDFEQSKGSFSKEDLFEILAYMAILYDEDKKAGLVKTVEKKTKDGKAVSIVLQSGSKMLKYKDFYLRDVNTYAGIAFSSKEKKVYEMITLALDPNAVVAELKGKPGKPGKPSAAEKKAGKAAAKSAEQVKEVQKALIDFFGPELEAKLGDEYTQGIMGKNTKYAFLKFSSEFADDPDFPKGKNRLKKMPKFIEKAAVEKMLAKDDTEAETAVAESKIDLQQKRLLEVNKRLMKI
jgi:hypothetical protein